ncbi:MAG: ACT domain-containing protein [Bacteroidales bacterium]|nr:ACT domain-containing protein [Candidatus Cacconaster scatequi]
MVTRQLSIFLENKGGRLSELSEILAAENINFSAWSLAETEEFGILRTIVSDPERACRILKEKHFAATLSDVVKFSVPDRPGALCSILQVLSQKGVFIEYMYSFSTEGGVACVILRPTDIALCEKALESIR